MDWEGFVKSLRRGEIGRIYLLAGDDRYLKTKALQQLESALFPKAKGEVMRYQAPEGVGDAVRDAQTFPFFAGMRLIVLENVEAVRADARKLMEPVLRDPSPFATLALVTGDEEGATCPKWIAEHAAEVTCSATPLDLRRWIQGWFKRQGLRVEPKAVEILAARSAGRFGSVVTDLEKIALVCPPGGTVTAGMAESASLDHSEEEVFALTGALLNSDRSRGVQALEDLLAQGEPAGHILTMLAKSLKLRWALAGAPPSVKDSELAAALGLSARWVASARRRGEKAEPGVAGRLWAALDEADQRLKTSAHSEACVLLAVITPGFGERRRGEASRSPGGQ